MNYKIKTRWAIFITFSVLLLGLGLVWLALGVGSLVLFYRLLNWSLARTIKTRLIAKFCLTFFYVFLVTILFRMFILEIYLIPTPSMENSLLVGDRVFVSKLHYGPSLPRTPFEIPWVNAFFYLRINSPQETDIAWWPSKRLNGLTEVTRNDILVFTRKNDRGKVQTKRCVGLPGDTIAIMDGRITINTTLYNAPRHIKQHYEIWHSGEPSLKNVFEKLDIDCNLMTFERECYTEADLSEDDLRLLILSSTIDSAKVKTGYPYKWRAYPKHKNIQWTIDDLGPLIVPAKGMKIEMSQKNFILYSKVLRDYEGVSLFEKDGAIYHFGEKIVEYTFKNDYYYLMGDNRLNSNDSRQWGFISDDNVIGKVICVAFSVDSKGLRWKRFMKLTS
jgi:signal peptidase I